MAERKTESVQKTAAQKLWEKIGSLPIDLFALPNQTVKDHVKREEKFDKVYPDALYLELKTAAVLPALEETLFTKASIGKDETFELTQQGKYTIVKIVPKLS